jgi:hypothetical protein
MFDSLDDQMKIHTEKESSPAQRLMLWAAIAIASVVVFGGLYYGVRMLE